MKIVLSSAIFLITSFYVSGQEIVEKVALSNGKSVLLFNNNTWKYEEKDTLKVTPLMQKKTTQNNTIKKQKKENNSYTSNICGARTKKGGYCQRRTGGGRCYQH